MVLSGYDEYNDYAEKAENDEGVAPVWRQVPFVLSSLPEAATKPMTDNFKIAITGALVHDKKVHAALLELDDTVQQTAAITIREKLAL